MVEESAKNLNYFAVFTKLPSLTEFLGVEENYLAYTVRNSGYCLLYEELDSSR
jgi:hypothetical protein